MAYKVLKGFREGSANYFHAGDMYNGKDGAKLEKDGFLEQILDKKAPAQESEKESDADMEMESSKKKGK